jgi:hypothetical protein
MLRWPLTASTRPLPTRIAGSSPRLSSSCACTATLRRAPAARSRRGRGDEPGAHGTTAARGGLLTDVGLGGRESLGEQYLYHFDRTGPGGQTVAGHGRHGLAARGRGAPHSESGHGRRPLIVSDGGDRRRPAHGQARIGPARLPTRGPLADARRVDGGAQPPTHVPQGTCGRRRARGGHGGELLAGAYGSAQARARAGA